MTSLSEQLSAVRQSQWEAQIDMLRTLSTRALDSAEQLIALNMKTSRASVEQATGTFKQILEANNPRDLVALGTAAQGQWQHMFAYGRELLGIATGGRARAWSIQPPAIALLPAPTANVPASVPQALEQAAIAGAGAASVGTELAAAAADTGSALAEATLHAGTEAAAKAFDAGRAALDAAPASVPAPASAPAPAPDAPEVTELEAEKTNAAPSETPAETPAEAPAEPPSEAPQAPAAKADGEGATAAKRADQIDAVLEIAVEPAAIVDAIVDQAISDDAPPAKAKPLAKALNKIAPKLPSAEHPIVSTVPLQAGDAIALPLVAPVDSTPPHVAPEPKPPRASRKK